jgi:methylated-DNA-[protein]-cysteine S-methyltransferase
MQLTFDSPIGPLTLVETDGAITALRRSSDIDKTKEAAPLPILEEAASQILSYLRGERRELTFEYRLHAAPFQAKVLQAVSETAYGETCTYGDIARLIGNPGASRAVGNALHSNPLPLIIPCHRVIPAHRFPGGFVWGEAVKRMLLEMEKIKGRCDDNKESCDDNSNRRDSGASRGDGCE